ncbi:hypothetical protein LI328DRAFT_169719 [Trichoderma asperelloides]|nr:hypothetical protein LI328DRAFT_169719 [Trichoderma asperelloides]
METKKTMWIWRRRSAPPSRKDVALDFGPWSGGFPIPLSCGSRRKVEIGDSDKDREHALVKLQKMMRHQQEIVDTGCCGLEVGKLPGGLDFGGLTLTSRRPVMSRPGRCILQCLFVYTPSAADALAQEAVGGSCAELPRVLGVRYVRTGHHANRSRNLRCRPGDDDIPGVAHSRGGRTDGPLVCFRTPDVLVASHLRWREIAEFHVCASTAAQRGGDGIWTALIPAA